MCSARGTVSLYVQLSALMHSYAGFGLAVHAVCWSGRRLLSYASECAPSARGTVSFVLSSRHYQLVCASVGSNAQLCRLWACSAYGVLDVAAAYTSYASQCAQLEAPSAYMCSCRLQCTAMQALGLRCMPCAGRGRCLLSHAWQRTQLEALSACMCSCRLQCTAMQALGLQCMRRAGRGRGLLSHASQLTQLEALSARTCSCRLQCTAMQALDLQRMRRAGRGRRLLFVCFAACSAGGTVALYVQLSALQCIAMQALGLQCILVHAACWTWPPLTFRFPRSVLSSRHCQLFLIHPAVGSNAQLCRPWACGACGVLDVAAASFSYASQCAQLEAASACTCSCRISNAQLCRLWTCSACGVQDVAAAYFFVCFAVCSNPK